MTTAPATISISRAGRQQALPPVTDPVAEVTRLLHVHAEASDVTVSIQLPNDHGLLLVALEAGNAFVGLETADGVYQYLADATAQGTRQFVISGQTSAIDTRYVLPIPTAIDLLKACLARPDLVAATTWERQ
jgi:hypothetical protein